MGDFDGWLGCPECDEPLFAPDADGLFEDGTRATCECGAEARISCDGEQCYVMSEADDAD